MNHRTAWTVYIVLRLLFFAVPLALLIWIGWPLWLAAITAGLVALALSVIFLHKQRSLASESVYEWRTRTRTEDEVVEDEVIDTHEDTVGTRPGTAGTAGAAGAPVGTAGTPVDKIVPQAEDTVASRSAQTATGHQSSTPEGELTSEHPGTERPGSDQSGDSRA